jgi:hypothetical protein
MVVHAYVVYENVPEVFDRRICPICGDPAPDNDTHHPHYGGISCLSCRAFFRRAHQNRGWLQFICKSSIQTFLTRSFYLAGYLKNSEYVIFSQLSQTFYDKQKLVFISGL